MSTPIHCSNYVVSLTLQTENRVHGLCGSGNQKMVEPALSPILT